MTVSFPVKARFILWRLRMPLTIAAILVAFLWPRATQATGASQSAPVALEDIARGAIIDESALGAPRSSQTDASSETEDLIGQIALVPIAEGDAVVPAMAAPSIQLGMVPQGKVLTVISLSNPDILRYVQAGTLLDIFGATEQSSERIVTGGDVIFSKTENIGGENQETWAVRPYDTNSGQDSSTVLLAVTPKEAAQLAQIPLWENSLVAAIVQ